MQRFVALGAILTGLVLAGCASGPDAELEEGFDLLVAQDYADARDHYESMLDEHPDNPYVHLNLGVAYQQLGERELARRHFEAAIAHGGGAEVTRVAEEAGVAAETSTVVELARQNLEVNVNPPGLNVELERGWELMVAGEYRAARDHYERLLTAYPNNPYVHLNLGVAYQRLGEGDLARLHHEAAVAHGGEARARQVAEDPGEGDRSGVLWWRETALAGDGQAAAPTRATTVADLAQRNLEIMAN